MFTSDIIHDKNNLPAPVEPSVAPILAPVAPVLAPIPPPLSITQKDSTKTNEYIILKTNNRPDINLRDVYSPLYFNTVNLESTIIMSGGWYQKYENLTIPFKYVVWLFERNPVVTNISSMKPLETDTFFQKMKNLILPSNLNEKKSSDVAEEPKQVEEVEPEEELDEEEEEEEEEVESEVESEEEEEVEAAEVEEPEIKDMRNDDNINASDKFSIQFTITPDIEHNGKTLKEILQECKIAPRTIETIDESGITYILLEKIVFDLHSQITYLTEHFNIIYSGLREEYIYNINGQYVIFDSDKLMRFDINNQELIKENNKLFSEFIQKLKFGESTLFQPSNDTIIENTHVDKLQRLLLR